MGPSVKLENDGTEYERLRLEKIQRNKQRMLELKLTELTDRVAETKPKRTRAPTTKGVKRQKTKEPVVISRRSRRVAGLTPDGKVNEDGKELRVGKLGEGIKAWSPHDLPATVEESKPRRLEGPVQFESVNESDRDSDKHFLEILQAKHAVANRTTTGCESLTGLDLDEENVVKMTKNGTTHVCIAPFTSTTVIATGDKSGNVGLWSSSDRSSDELIMQVRPHLSYVSGMRWCPGTNSLFSCSYDGTVRSLDAEKGVFSELFTSEELELSAFDVNAKGHTALLCDKDGEFLVLDARTKTPAIPQMTLLNRKINTVHFEPTGENLFVTSCTDSDNGVCIFDIRNVKKGAPVVSYYHPKSCQGAFFAPDGSQRIVTTCYDCNLRVYDGKRDVASKAKVTSPIVKVHHNTQTGRWVIPFRAVWTPASDGFVCGTMNRQVR